jgi:2-polyprenyl-6-hydroxyphenyl methylase/3-demethylubiquinone-9 3-methyltransferase
MFKFRVRENSYGHKKRLDFIVKQIEKYCFANSLNQKEIRILDVGCGSGLLVTLPLGSLGYNILGIDFDENSIKFANTQNIFREVRFEKGMIESINDKYDIILVCEVLEHVEKPIEFLNTVKSKLKSNGIIVLTAPNGYG